MSEHCILVIEDQEDLAELYETTLKRAGYGVRLAMTGEEGVGEFQAHGADVVLLDMTLPEMNGAEVLKQIREVNASVPVKTIPTTSRIVTMSIGMRSVANSTTAISSRTSVMAMGVVIKDSVIMVQQFSVLSFQ